MPKRSPSSRARQRARSSGLPDQMAAMFTAGATPMAHQVLNVPDSWATRISESRMKEWRAGTATTCQHLMNPKVSDNVGIVVAWEDDKIACPLCSLALMPGTDSATDNMCDQCGADTKDDPRGLKQCRLATGQVLFFYFLCADCDTGGPMGPLERDLKKPGRKRPVKERPNYLKPNRA